GVVVDAGALDAGAVAGRRRVVEGKEQPLARAGGHQRPEDVTEQTEGEVAGVPARGPEGAVGGAEIVGDARGAEPRGDGAAAAGEQGADEELPQVGSGAAGGGGHQVGKTSRPKGRQERQ